MSRPRKLFRKVRRHYGVLARDPEVRDAAKHVAALSAIGAGLYFMPGMNRKAAYAMRRMAGGNKWLRLGLRKMIALSEIGRKAPRVGSKTLLHHEIQLRRATRLGLPLSELKRWDRATSKARYVRGRPGTISNPPLMNSQGELFLRKGKPMETPGYWVGRGLPPLSKQARRRKLKVKYRLKYLTRGAELGVPPEELRLWKAATRGMRGRRIQRRGVVMFEWRGRGK